jgi:hypothetical protein
MHETTRPDFKAELEHVVKRAKDLESYGEFNDDAKYVLVCELLDISQRQTNQAIDELQSTTQSLNKIVTEYNTLVKKYDAVPELLFTAFSLDPAGVLAILLADIERSAKISDQSGQSWRWNYVLTLKNRLKVAWRLIFRPKVKDAELEGVADEE